MNIIQLEPLSLSNIRNSCLYPIPSLFFYLDMLRFKLLSVLGIFVHVIYLSFGVVKALTLMISSSYYVHGYLEGR
jgi:hypothetical protein